VVLGCLKITEVTINNTLAELRHVITVYEDKDHLFTTKEWVIFAGLGMLEVFWLIYHFQQGRSCEEKKD
jgi:hypothetical protein